jgi:hypothetical protein
MSDDLPDSPPAERALLEAELRAIEDEIEARGAGAAAAQTDADLIETAFGLEGPPGLKAAIADDLDILRSTKRDGHAAFVGDYLIIMSAPRSS